MNFKISNIHFFSFDFDGTLIQSNHVKAQAFEDVVLRVSNGNNDAVAVLKKIKKNNPHYDRYAIFKSLEEHFPDLDAQTLAQLYSNQCENIILACPEVGGASLLLKSIKNLGKRAVINSATPKKDLEKIVNQLSIKSYIEEVYGAPKTKTENLIALMSKYNLDPSQIMVIGDGENDKEASVNVGCPFYGLTNEYSDLNPKEQHLHADLHDLVKFLNVIKISEKAVCNVQK